MANIAVIMCVYHADEVDTLSKAFDSLVQQSISNDIYIYRDGTVGKELDALLKEFDTRDNVFLFVNSENKGLAHGLNTLIDRVLDGNYEYIARMDSDDISLQSRLEVQKNYFLQHADVDVCGTYCREFGASYAMDVKTVPVDHDSILDFSIARCPFIHPTVMFRASVFRKGIRYPTNTTLTEDMALWFLLLDSGYRFSNIDEVQLDYFLSENTVNRRRGLSKALSEVKIRTKYMFKLNKFSLRNFALIYSRLVFNVLPLPLMKYFYKNAR